MISENEVSEINLLKFPPSQRQAVTQAALNALKINQLGAYGIGRNKDGTIVANVARLSSKGFRIIVMDVR